MKTPPPPALEGSGRPRQNEYDDGHAQLSFRDESAFTALITACEDGDLKTVQHVIPRLKNKAWLDRTFQTMATPRGDRSGRHVFLMSPIGLAAANGHIGVARKLLASGASLETDPDPLEIACLAGQVPMAKFLLGKGASYILASGKSILELALQQIAHCDQQANQHHHIDTAFITWLLKTEVGDLIDIAMTDGATPLGSAIRHHNHTVIELLLNYGADPNTVAGNDDTALNHAVRGHDLRLMKLLVAANADLVPEPPSLKSAILTACECHNMTAVEYLTKELGSCVNRSTVEFESAFVVACLQDDLSIAKWLLAQGFVDLEAVSQLSGDTALLVCAKKGLLPAVRILVEAGADMEARGAGGELAPTPLHTAVMAGSVEMTAYLLRQGADFTAEAEKEQVMSDMSVAASGKTETFALQQPACLSKLLQPMYLAIHLNNFDIVKVFVEQHADLGIDLDWADPATGYTALHIAAELGQSQIARVLVEKGTVNLNAEIIENQSTALILAALAGHLGTVQYLTELPATSLDFRLHNAAGRSPIANAKAAGFTRVATLLETVIARRSSDPEQEVGGH